ncbi:MAG: ribokinase [Deltaproteobacteria bacterium]|nr:ribokinase [Deltaproteobacteria bacterium]
MRDVVVVGSINVDVSLRAERLPLAGETVHGDALVVGPGGKGLNQAIAAARLGGRVHLVGCAGTDRLASVALDALRDAQVDDTYVRELTDATTGTALIIVSSTSGENQIAIAAGANARVDATAVRDAISAFRASSVLLTQLEIPLDAVSAALEQAKTEHLTTVLDPAPAPQDLDDALLRRVDVLTPNETEAEALSGVCVRDVESAARAGSVLRGRTQGDVVVTLGAEGCVWSSSTGFEHIPAPRVDPVDTTGAGDAFNGGLAVALARGEPLARALHHAVLAGTAATTRRGAADAMPRQADLHAL